MPKYQVVLGQQVSRTVGSGGSAVVTLSVHDLSGNRIAEHDDTGAVIREYIWLDGRPLAVVEGGQTYQLHWDHIMRPVMATDSTGAVVWAASYLPFGGIDQVYVDTGAIAQNLRFPGQWFQAETGLHQNGMRDYDPTTGRYLQADPLGLVDGPSVYGYARQSPVRWTDPKGLQAYEMSLQGFLNYLNGTPPVQSQGEPFVPFSQLPLYSREILRGRITWHDEIYRAFLIGCEPITKEGEEAIFMCQPGQNPFSGRPEDRANCVRVMPPGTGSAKRFPDEYPHGYSVFYDGLGRPISPYSGRPVRRNSPQAHTPNPGSPTLIPVPGVQ